MRTRYKFLLTTGTLSVVWATYTASQGPFVLKRSVPGQVVRHIAGKPGVVQSVDDLADELSLPANATALREWATQVLGTRRASVVPASNVQFDWLLPCVPATDIAPPLVLAKHRALFGSTPETYLHVSSDGHVAAVMLSWAHLRAGLVVLPGGSAPALQGTFYQRQPAADIRVFSTYS